MVFTGDQQHAASTDDITVTLRQYIYSPRIQLQLNGKKNS